MMPTTAKSHPPRETTAASLIQGPGPFDRWAPRIVVGLAFLAPLFFWLNIQDAFDLPKLTLVCAGNLALLTLWAVQVLQRQAIQVRRTAWDFPLLLFCGSAVLSGFYSVEPWLSWLGTYRIYVFGILPILNFALLFWFAAQIAAPALAERVRTAAMVSAGLAGLYGVLQYTGHEIFLSMPPIAGGRVWSSLGNPLYLGALCMMALPLALCRLMPKSGSVLAGSGIWTTWVPTGFILTGLALSLSRSAWMGAGAVVGFLLITRWKIWISKKYIVLLLLSAAVALAALPGVRQRASVMISMREGSNAARVEGWKAGWRIFQAHPFLGTGPDTFFTAFRPHRSVAYLRAAGPSVTQGHAHNDLIQIAATQGALGLAAYLLLCGLFLRQWKRGMFSDPAMDGLALALPALWIQDQFNFSAVATSVWAAIFAGLLFGISGSRVERRLSPGVSRLLVAPLLLLPWAVWAVSRPWQADSVFKHGLIRLERRQIDRAVKAFEHATRLHPGVRTYRTEQVNALRTLAVQTPEGPDRERYFDQAWQAADEASRAHPANPDVWNNRGVAAMWMVQLARRPFEQEARRSFEKAIEFDPVFVDAWANLAKWEHLAGHLPQEIELWKKVLELDPNHVMGRRVLGQNGGEPRTAENLERPR